MNLLSAAVVAILLPLSALAVEDVDTAAPGAPINPSERRGWTAGVTAGVGDIHIFPEDQDEQTLEAKSGSLCLGRAFGQRTLGLVWGEYASEEMLTHSGFGAGLQVFVTDRFFVRGGGGIMHFKTGSADPADPANELDIDRWTPGAELGIGVEWFQFRDMAINTQLAYIAAFYDTEDEGGDFSAYNVSLRVGVQWYGL